MLLDKIKSDLKQAMVGRDEVKTSTLRMVIAAENNARIAKGSDLTDEELVTLIAKEAKQRDEATLAAKNAGRSELVEKNEAEKSVLAAYLPKQLSEAEIEEIVVSTIHEVGATSPSDMGKVMAAVMPKLKGSADGSVVSRLVSQHLGS